MLKREFRFLATEVRAKAGSDKPVITGYAAMFNSLSGDLGGFVEVIRPGAFTRTLAEGADIRCFFNHKDDNILGRTKSGTLRVWQDDVGLKFECDVPDTSVGRDVYASIVRGDVDQCSFGFCTPYDGSGDNWIPTNDSPGILRELLDVDLFDVSPVTFPAYGSTSVTARSLFPDGMEMIETRKAGVVAKTEKELRDAMGTSNSGALIPQGFAVPYAKAKKSVRGEDPFQSEDEANGIINWSMEDEDRDAGTKKINVAKASQGFAYVNGDGSQRSDYMLPHHTIVDGELAHSQAGTKQAISDFNSGAVQVPEQYRADVFAHLQSEQSMFDEYEDDDDVIFGEPDTDDASLVVPLNTEDQNSNAPKSEVRKTKKVAGMDLPSSAFAYVGDEKNTGTWKLPIHFPGDDAKTINHIKNAIARFPDTKGIPASESSAVWHKIVGAAKAHGIKVNEKKSSEPVVETVVAAVVPEVPAVVMVSDEERERLQMRARAALEQ